MSSAISIAVQEWRYWSRTKLAGAVSLIALLLVCISVFATSSQISKERETRESLQVEAQETFRDQPARHPHRMVHYGHYVFRTPTALAALDPGVEPFTGTVMFLEGHRQNSATFSPSYDGAQAGPFSRLSPALVYQLLAPLILIVMGFGMVAREREASTDRILVASGISPVSMWAGKTIALLGVALLLLTPLLLGAILARTGFAVTFTFIALYLLYFTAWVLVITAISSWSPRSSVSLLILLSAWLVLCALLPRIIVSASNNAIPNNSQIETDMDVIFALRSVGDGHNANDPAFSQLRANLLQEYGVNQVEDLPVNFRGLVAQTSEADLTKILNEYAEKRMANHHQQTQFVKSLEFLSPFVALQSASMIVAGTDGKTHHRFLREAEALRFEFVQGLNNAHAHEMSYSDDVNRGQDDESNLRARVSADNWRVLNDFHFHPDSAATRLERVSSSIGIVGVWILVFAIFGFVGARRLPEIDHG